MYKEIDIEAALELNNACFVDVRSPQEYEEDTIPGAINIPLFTNEERHRIGLVYAEQGPQEARKLGLEFVSGRLPELVERIAAAKNNHQLIIFCWRGGDRSKAVAGILETMHIPCLRLIGGYKAYRQYINKTFHESRLSHQFVVLHGLTGTGKTEIIKELERRGYPVLDLETLANHRGSVFGGIGLGAQPSQKKFESLIWEKIKSYKNSRVLIVEGESKRIGRLFLPDAVYNGMRTGYRILVYDTVNRRVERLIKEYVSGSRDKLDQVQDSLFYLTRRLGKDKVARLQQLLAENDLEQAGKMLLVDYYDVLYGRTIEEPEKYDLTVDAGDFLLAVKKVEKFVQQLS